MTITENKEFLGGVSYVVENPPLYKQFILADHGKSIILMSDKLKVKIWLNPISLEARDYGKKSILSSECGDSLELKGSKKITAKKATFGTLRLKYPLI